MFLAKRGGKKGREKCKFSITKSSILEGGRGGRKGKEGNKRRGKRKERTERFLFSKGKGQETSKGEKSFTLGKGKKGTKMSACGGGKKERREKL